MLELGLNSPFIAMALDCGCSIRDFILQIDFTELRPGKISLF